MSIELNRRNFLRLIGLGAVGAVLQACQPQPVEKEVTRVVEKEKVVTATPAKKAETPVVSGSEQQVAAGQVVTDARKIETTLLSCRDGELVLNHNVPAGERLPRTPVGEAERANIMEVAWWDDGFGGYDRAIVVVPQLGPVWQVNVKQGAATIATRGFCGTPEEVETWAVKAHVPSLQQASRDPQGNQPKASEIAVYRLHFENQEMRVAIKATDSTAPTPEWVLSQLDVSFREGNKSGSVQMHVAK